MCYLDRKNTMAVYDFMSLSENYINKSVWIFHMMLLVTC